MLLGMVTPRTVELMVATMTMTKYQSPKATEWAVSFSPRRASASTRL